MEPQMHLKMHHDCLEERLPHSGGMVTYRFARKQTHLARHLVAVKITISIDLVAMYGVNELTLHQEFPDGKAATEFIQDYCLHKNKQVKVISSGRVKKYYCPNKSCEWLATCTRSKVAPFPFRVSTLHLKHDDACILAARPTRRQIANLPEFRVAVQSDSNAAALTLLSTVQSTSQIALDDRTRTLYRAKEAVLEERAGDYGESFARLPSLLRELKEANPGSTIALENDQAGRFFRAFVCLAGTVRCLPSCQHVYGFDGAHFKKSKYTGVILSLLSRDGDNHNFPVAFGLVSSENETNVRWFSDLCLQAGVPLSSESPPPLFCDRGVLLGVAADLERDKQIFLNLKYCSIHIIRNIKRNFGLGGPKLESHVWEIQGAETSAAYETAIQDLKTAYGDSVAHYVRETPPANWTVHASSTKLYGWRSTNFVESHNAVLDKNGVRTDTPFDAIQRSVKNAMLAISTRSNRYREWAMERKRFTPYAQALFEKERSEAGAYEVSKSSDSTFFVHRKGHKSTRRVTLHPKLACSCNTFKQFGVPCRHIIRVLNYTNLNNRVVEAFDACFLVTTFEGFTTASVELALDDRITATDDVAPAPQYKQVGRRVTRRIRSGGETGVAKVYRCKQCGEAGRHNKRTCRRHSGAPIVRASQLFGAAVDLEPPAVQLLSTLQEPESSKNDQQSHGEHELERQQEGDAREQPTASQQEHEQQEHEQLASWVEGTWGDVEHGINGECDNAKTGKRKRDGAETGENQRYEAETGESEHDGAKTGETLIHTGGHVPLPPKRALLWS